METLRLHPPVAEEAKYATRDVPFPDSTVVPSGTRLMFLPYAMGRYPRRYPKPDEFNPNRWISYRGYPDPYDFTVFQAGYRECSGKGMAMFEAKLVASMLLQRFSFTLQEGENITYSLMLTMSLCYSGSPEDLGDDRTHELWLKPTRRPTSA